MRAGAAAACGALALSAAAADAATLKVKVTPTTVHRSGTYAITITGSYRRRGRHPAYSIRSLRRHQVPYLLAFIQYTGSSCRRTATAEYALPTREWSWVFYPPRFEHDSSFKIVVHEQPRTRFGNRRICAYLYGTKIDPRTKAAPIAAASAGFREARR